MEKLYQRWKQLELYKKLGLLGFLIGIIGYIPKLWFLNYAGFLLFTSIGQYICEGYNFFNKCLFFGYMLSPLINALTGMIIGFLITKLKK